MRRRKRRTPKKQVSELSKIIDYPFEAFKKEVIEQKIPIGQINTTVLILENVYADLRSRKDAVLNLVFTKQKTKEEVQSALDGLFAEMTKIEQKVVFLKERSKELLDITTS